jgi:hypothetical protein
MRTLVDVSKIIHGCERENTSTKAKWKYHTGWEPILWVVHSDKIMAKNHREWQQKLSLTNMTQSIIPELWYYFDLRFVTGQPVTAGKKERF